jgi:hypothetical protein
MMRLLVVSAISLLVGVAFFIAVVATDVVMNLRRPFMAEKIALEIACPIAAQRGDSTPAMKADCAIYARTGLVRRDFK